MSLIKSHYLAIILLFLIQNILSAQTMTFDSGPNYTGFSFSGWGSVDGILYPAEPNVNGVATISKQAFCWNLISFETRKFGTGGGYRITSNKGHSYTFYPNNQSSKIHTLNWEEIQSVQVVLFDVSTSGVNFSYDFDNVVFTVPIKTAADMPTVTASKLSLCPGESTTLNISGNLNSATTWKVYSGACGQNLLTSTESNTVDITPSAETIYFVRGEKDECTPVGECSTGISISLKTESTAITSLTSDMNPICQGEEFTLTASGGIDGDEATIQWYTGPNGNGENIASGLGPHTFVAVDTQTFYVRREGLCNNSADNSIIQNVELCPCKDLGGDADKDGICDGLGRADLNVGVMDEELSGNLSTNDKSSTELFYGDLSAIQGHQNPDSALPNLNADGTYTFTGTSAGVYLFQIAVCPMSEGIDCPVSQLKLTILEASNLESGPIVNTDLAMVRNSSTLTFPILTNDASGRPNGILGSPTILLGPSHADDSSIDINNNLIYNPLDDYTGPDTITYQVCDTGLNPEVCSSGLLIIEVLPFDAINSLGTCDDFVSVLSDIETSNKGSSNGNVLLNDIDPDGDDLSTIAQMVTKPGGTFELDDMGNYTFNSTSNFIGSESFVYTVNDEAGNSFNATIYIRITTSSGVLPVSYTSFDSHWRDQVAVLNWVTSSEVDNDYYSIERSEEGKTFVPIGQINAESQHINGERKYAFLDRDAKNLNVSNIYYRLKQVDFNGQYSYSSISSLISKSYSIDYNIYPNPNSGEFAFEHLRDAKTVGIFNMLGQLVYLKEIEGPEDLHFQLDNLTSGNYSLIIKDHKNQKHVQRLIIQNGR